MSKLLKKDQEKLGLVHYEVQMFKGMYRHITNKSTKELPKDLQNAILESFLLHIRNLIDFFQGTADKGKGYKRNCKDIIVRDFKDEEGEYLDIVEEWSITPEDKKKINKRLAHLSEDRLTEEKDWGKEIVKFEAEIEKQIKIFLEKISNEYFPLTKNHQEITKDNFGQCKNNFSNVDEKMVVISSTDSDLT